MSNDANTDYGKQVWQAFQAIQQLHVDCDRLLQDCDSVLGISPLGKARASLFNTVTRGLSKAIGQPYLWMPTALYRCYDASDEQPGLVEALTICFMDDEPQRHNEPLIIVGRIQYSSNPTAERATNPRNGSAGEDSSEEIVEASGRAKSVNHSWDLWNAYFYWSEPPRLGEVMRLGEMDAARITAIHFIVQPLFSIQSIDDVKKLMEQVRQSAA